MAELAHKLTVEEGKRYVRRNGTVTQPLVKTKSFFGADWLNDPDMDYDYDPESPDYGWMVHEEINPDHPYDLMREATEDDL